MTGLKTGAGQRANKIENLEASAKPPCVDLFHARLPTILATPPDVGRCSGLGTQALRPNSDVNPVVTFSRGLRKPDLRWAMRGSKVA